MNMRIDKGIQEALDAGIDQPSSGLTSWCSCGSFLVGVLMAVEQQMVGVVSSPGTDPV